MVLEFTEITPRVLDLYIILDKVEHIENGLHIPVILLAYCIDAAHQEALYSQKDLSSKKRQRVGTIRYARFKLL